MASAGLSFLFRLMENDRPLFCLQPGRLDWRKRCGHAVWIAFHSVWRNLSPGLCCCRHQHCQSSDAHRRPLQSNLPELQIWTDYSGTGANVSTAPVSVSVGGSHSFFCRYLQPPLAALCSLSSHWHQHKYYPNQRRKFFLNLDDKDIFLNLC